MAPHSAAQSPTRCARRPSPSAMPHGMHESPSNGNAALSRAEWTNVCHTLAAIDRGVAARRLRDHEPYAFLRWGKFRLAALAEGCVEFSLLALGVGPID